MLLHRTAFILALVAVCVFPACGGGSGDGVRVVNYGENPLPDNPGGDPRPVPPPPEPPVPPGGPGELQGGVLVTIDTGGEIWHWWVTNPTTTMYLERAWNGTYTGRFNGTIREGPGAAAHNAPWSWHVDPETNGHDIVFFAPPSGHTPSTPSECENQLTLWLSQDTRFIASPFVIVAFEDYRP